MKQIELTVAVCVKDDARIKRLLASIAAQTADHSRFEVVVVTTGMHRFEECVEEFPGLNLRLFHSPVARHSVQRNIAINATRGSIFLSTDADCVATSEWIGDMLRAFEDAPPDLVGVGGRITKYKQTSITQRFGITIDDGQRSLNYLPAMPLPYITGANSGYRTNAVNECGGYDESFTSAEDVDLSYKLQLGGGHLKIVSGAEIAHEDRKSLYQHFRRFEFYATDQALLFKKYSPHSKRRASLNPYAWKRLGQAAASLVAGAPALMSGEVGPLATAMTAAAEASGVLVGSARGSFKHRVLYL